MKRKILALLLCCVMVLGMLPTTALATEEVVSPRGMERQTISGTWDEAEGAYKSTVNFTPTESGLYFFGFFDQYDGCGADSICVDSNDNAVDCYTVHDTVVEYTSVWGRVYDLTADTTYTFHTADGAATRDVIILPGVAAEGISYEGSAVTGYVGGTAETYFTLSPSNKEQEDGTKQEVFGGVTFTSSDETVLSLFGANNCDPFGHFTCLKAGTVTVTATTVNGHSATCTVTVEKAEELKLTTDVENNEKTLTLDPGEEIVYSFDGAGETVYYFYCSGEGVGDVEIRPELAHGNGWSYNYSGSQGELRGTIVVAGDDPDATDAGDGLIYLCNWHPEEARTITVGVREPITPTSCTITGETSVYAGGMFSVAAQFEPMYSFDGSLQLSLTNPDDVVSIISEGPFDMELMAEKAGTATITVTTTDTQLSASSTITVIETEELELTTDEDNNEKTLTLDPGEEMVYSFTGTAGALYYFYYKGNEIGDVEFRPDVPGYGWTVDFPEGGVIGTMVEYHEDESGLVCLINHHGTEQRTVTVGVVQVDGNPVATIGGTKFYSDLQDAIDAAAAGDRITILDHIELDEGVTVAADKVITIDLNGYRLSMEVTDEISAHNTLIKNCGDLTICDSGEGGIISYNFDGTVAEANAWKYAVTAISNQQGTLTIKGGTIESLSTATNVYKFTVDNLTNGNGSDATLVVEGGTITAEKGGSIRGFANSTTCTCSIEITGGEITGQVWLQDPNTSKNLGVLDITGGTIWPNTPDVDAVYLYGLGDASGMNVHLGGDVLVEGTTYITSASTTAAFTASIDGGTYREDVWVGTWNSASEYTAIEAITGGRFFVDPSDYMAEGYRLTADGDAYGVKSSSMSVTVGGSGSGEGDGDEGGSSVGTTVNVSVGDTGTGTTEVTNEDSGEGESQISEETTTAVSNTTVTGLDVYSDTVATDAGVVSELVNNLFGNDEVPENAEVTISAVTSLQITVQEEKVPAGGGNDGEPSSEVSVKLNIVPVTTVTATYDDDGEEKEETATGEITVSTPVEITVGLPAAFAECPDVFIIHTKDDGSVFRYHGYKEVEYNGDGLVKSVSVSFENPHGFSEFYITSENYLAAVGVGNYYTSLQAAADEADAEQITLLDDIYTEDAPALIVGDNQNIVLDLNGYSVNSGYGWYTIDISGGAHGQNGTATNGKLTIVGDGVISNIHATSTTIRNYGTLVIEEKDGGYPSIFCTDNKTNDQNSAIKTEETATTTLYAGYYEGYSRAIQSFGKTNIYGGDYLSAVQAWKWREYDSCLNIYGGYFFDDVKVCYVEDSEDCVEGAAITIEGGYFAVCDPTEYCAAGYEVVSVDGEGNPPYWVTPDVTIEMANVKAGDTLSLIFYIPMGELNCDVNGDTVGYYAEVIRGNETVTIEEEDWTTEGEYVRFAFEGIAAKEMTDEVVVRIYHSTDDTPASNELTYSVYEYAMRALAYAEETGNMELGTVVVDMLNYGAACQKYFGYNTENLANRDITEEQQAWYATQQDVEISNNTTSDGEHLKYISVSAEDDLYLSFYFTGIDQNMTAYITYTDHYGNEKQVEVTGDKFREFTIGVVSGYIVDVTGLAVADGRKMVTCTVKNGETTVAWGTSSVESYAAIAANSNSGVAAIAQPLMKFVDSAYEYFH